MRPIMLLGLIATAGCAAPAYVFHSYRFEGRIVDDATGAPVRGSTVQVEAKTDPFEGTEPHRGQATSADDGSFEIELQDGWCHACWVCPPLGILGGSGMNVLEAVQLRVDREPARTARVHERIEPARFTIRHRLGDIRVPRM